MSKVIEGEPIQHPMMPRTKLCALTNLTINTTPFGQLQTIFDGTIPVVTMELQFKETTKLTRVDMEGSSYKRNEGRWIYLIKGKFVGDPSNRILQERYHTNVKRLPELLYNFHQNHLILTFFLSRTFGDVQKY